MSKLKAFAVGTNKRLSANYHENLVRVGTINNQMPTNASSTDYYCEPEDTEAAKAEFEKKQEAYNRKVDAFYADRPWV